MPGGRNESREGRAVNNGIENAKTEGKQYYIHNSKYGGGHVYDVVTGKRVDSGKLMDMVDRYDKDRFGREVRSNSSSKESGDKDRFGREVRGR